MDRAIVSGVGLMAVSAAVALSVLYTLTGSRIAAIRYAGAALGVAAAAYGSALGLALVADNWDGGLRVGGRTVLAVCALTVASACRIVRRGLTPWRG